MWGGKIDCLYGRTFGRLNLARSYDATGTERETASISRSYVDLKFARSECLSEMSDLDSIAAIKSQIEVRDAILQRLDNVRSEFARQYAPFNRRSYGPHGH